MIIIRVIIKHNLERSSLSIVVMQQQQPSYRQNNNLHMQQQPSYRQKVFQSLGQVSNLLYSDSQWDALTI